jgi:hypothetical protein
VKPEELFANTQDSREPRHTLQIGDAWTIERFEMSVEELYQHFKVRLVREVMTAVDGCVYRLVDMTAMVPDVERQADIAKVVAAAKAVVAAMPAGHIYFLSDLNAFEPKIVALRDALKGF